MTNAEKIAFKKSLQSKCISLVEDKIVSIRLAMQEAQSAANSEEKSSAGDKYETARAMSHLEKDMQGSRLSVSLKELENLLLINCDKVFDSAQPGSFVQCDKAAYFIAVGLGKLIFANQPIFFVSPNAPIALQLAGKKPGDRFEFNNQKVMIAEVY